MAKKINEVLNNPLSFPFCSLLVMIRYLLMSIICILNSACPPAPPFWIDFCFQILLGGLYIPKRISTQYLMQNLRGKQRALWGFENSQWERSVYAPVAPVPHYSPLRSHGIFLASHKREFWSRKYLLRTCIRKTALWLKGYIFDCFILLFCKICFLYLTVKPSASRSLSKCRLRGFKMETLNSVHYLTNLRSTLLVTSRISCYEVAYARLSESRAAEKIK